MEKPKVFHLKDLTDMPITLSPVSPKSQDSTLQSPSGDQIEEEPDTRVIEPTEGNTELHTACIEFDVPKVSELLENGISVNRTNIKDRSCLHEMVLSYLLCDMVQQAAHYKKLIDIISLLAKAGLDMNMGDENEQTPLHYVVTTPHQEDLIRALYSAGVKVNSMDKNEETALHKAVRKGIPTMVMALLEGGADPNVENKRNDTPMHIAVKGRHHIVTLTNLLDCGGVVDCFDGSFKTPLHIAAKKGHLQFVEILLNRKAKVWHVDNSGQTALHLAAGFDMTGQVCRALLASGADPNVVDHIYMESPLHKAVRMKMTQNIEVLVSHKKTSLSLQDYCGDTPLHKAARLKDVWAWRNLLLRGYRYIELHNKVGKTAARLAQEAHNHIAISLMKPHLNEPD